MGFQQGLSGLNAASKTLEVIGNNVANSNTVGFKESQALFADVYASSLTGTGASQVGIGTKVSQVAQQFTQGNITASNNPLDLAINGGGFFRMSKNGTVTYGRNGQFQMDKGGYIVSANGARLQGFIADKQGTLATGASVDLNIRSDDLPPLPTSKVQAVVNLNSSLSKPVTSPFDITDPTSYNSATSVSVFDSLGNSHVMQTFFVKKDPVAPSVEGTWDVYAASDGVAIGYVAAAPTTNASPTVGSAPASFGPIAAGTFSINGVTIGAVAAGTNASTQGANVAAAITAAAVPGVRASADAAGVVTVTSTSGSVVIGMNGNAANLAAANANKSTLAGLTGFSTAQIGTQAISAPAVGTLRFKTDGSIDPVTTSPAPPLPFAIAIPISNTSGAQNPLLVNIDFTGTTQFGAPFSVSKLTQDGYTSGRLSGFNIGPDGMVTGRYTNGQSSKLGQVVLASFSNPNGLQPLGNNEWAESATSGAALIGSPSSGNLGVLQASAVEDSNVDLTAELVNMITAQRVYQANAQTIKTQDQVLQTLVNMR